MKRVIFVCIGNACRSQMAEAFANAYGPDVLEAASAGLAPTVVIPDDTLAVMSERNLDLCRRSPKRYFPDRLSGVDIIVNMSGLALPEPLPHCDIREWPVQDPFGGPRTLHRKVRDEIERRVMDLVLELRKLERKKAVVS